MSELAIVTIIIIATGGIPLVALGTIIAVKQKGNWINGVDQSSLSNRRGFITFVGHSVSITGILISVLAGLLYFGTISWLAFGLAIIGVSLLPLPCLFIAKLKYA